MIGRKKRMPFNPGAGAEGARFCPVRAEAHPPDPPPPRISSLPLYSVAVSAAGMLA